jgi:cell division protease FtsH
MVMRYAMVTTLGHVAYEEEQAPFMNGNIFQKSREYSEETAREIDVAVRAIVEAAYAKALAILQRHRGALETWAKKLLEKETLVEAELVELRNAVALP